MFFGQCSATRKNSLAGGSCGDFSTPLPYSHDRRSLPLASRALVPGYRVSTGNTSGSSSGSKSSDTTGSEAGFQRNKPGVFAAGFEFLKRHEWCPLPQFAPSLPFREVIDQPDNEIRVHAEVVSGIGLSNRDGDVVSVVISNP
jgi:hypothetical protein